MNLRKEKEKIGIINLNEEQVEEIQESLENYNDEHIKYRIEGGIALGIEEDGRLIAGLVSYMSVFKILYVDTVFVEESYRRKGYGRRLMEEMEKRAKEKGVTLIRLDTFDWQGKDFYLSLGYEEVGHYRSEEDDFEESFFLKRIGIEK